MSNELFELAIELAESAVEDVRGTGYRDSVPYLLDALAEHCGLLPLGDTQKTAIAKGIAGEPIEPPTSYRLCDKLTGEPVDYCPDTTFEDIADVQLANAELDGRGLVWRSEKDIADQREREQAAEQERTRWHLKECERLVLNDYAAANGRTWKHKLRLAWQRGDAPTPLQYLATHRCFGPDGLERYRLPKALASLST